MKKIILAMTVFSSLVMANDAIQIEKMIRQEAIQDNSDASYVENRIDGNREIVKDREERTDTFEDATIVNLLNLEYKKSNKSHSSAGSLSRSDNVSIERKRLEKRRAADAANLKEQQTKIDSIFTQEIHLTGLCIVPKPILVRLMPSYSTLDCYFDENDADLRHASMLINVVPYSIGEAIIGEAKYFETTDLDGDKKDRFNVLEGILMTPDMTSLNLASYFNSNQFARLASKEAINANNAIYSLSRSYLDAKQASRMSQEISYINTGIGVNSPLQTTVVAPPKASDYVIAGSIAIATGITNAVLEGFYDDAEYIWSIYAGSQIYFDIVASHSSIKNNKFSYGVQESLNKASVSHRAVKDSVSTTDATGARK